MKRLFLAASLVVGMANAQMQPPPTAKERAPTTNTKSSAPGAWKDLVLADITAIDVDMQRYYPAFADPENTGFAAKWVAALNEARAQVNTADAALVASRADTAQSEAAHRAILRRLMKSLRDEKDRKSVV